MDKEIAVYGMTREAIEDQYINSLTAKLSGMEMVVAGILSDCQEMMSYQYAAEVNKTAASEQVRKQLNVAKFILFRMMDQRQDEEMVLVSSDDKEIV